MKRDEWEFQYTAGKLAAGCRQKLDHHMQRLLFWESAKEKVMADIRKEGIDVLESAAGSNYSKSPMTPQVIVRNDLQRRLTECHDKILEHNRHMENYRGWHEVLSSHPDQTLTLNADDYLFFFSSPGPAAQRGPQ